MRRLAFIKSLILISSTPSVVAFLVSILTRFSTPAICNSALSSIVIILSLEGIKFDIAFKKVVFPEPVPPQIKILYPAITISFSISAVSCVIVCHSTRCFIVIASLKNFLIVTIGPFIATGSKTILTLEPSSNLASTIGEASFTLLFTLDAICCIISANLSLDANCNATRSISPFLSTKIS